MKEVKFSLGDKRLNRRAALCLKQISENPSVSFPQCFDEPCELEGLYRFLNNPNVDLSDLKESIYNSTFTRAREHREVLAIHDTTEVKMSRVKAEHIKGFGRDKGFHAHVSLLTSNEELPEVLGVGGIYLWTSAENPFYLKNESDRWREQAIFVQSHLPRSNVIHVMDRGGDILPVWNALASLGAAFVVRCRFNRYVVKGKTRSRFLDELAAAPVLMKRNIAVSKRSSQPYPSTARRYPTRRSRMTEVSIAPKLMEIMLAKSTRPTGEIVPVNAVHVFEKAHASSSIDWILLTNLPISTPEEVERVVDIYRRRWIIEEFFKGLKTGCKIEEKLLAESKSWYRLFTLLMPVCASMLNLRNLLRVEGSPNSGDLSETQWKVLSARAKQRGRKVKTYNDAFIEIARMGGYIVNNGGPPGWLTLLRGYIQLMLLQEGWLLAQEM